MLDNPVIYLPDAEKLQAYFGYPAYKKKLQQCLHVEQRIGSKAGKT
jgi:hypothetical protein